MSTHTLHRLGDEMAEFGTGAGSVNHLLAAAAAVTGSSCASPRLTEPAPLSRRFLCCPSHPEEPLQYFCLECQTECICAECVIHGEHRGHEVLNVREAVRRLPEKVGELATSTRLQAERLAGVVQRASESRRELAAVAERSRKDLRTAIEQLGLAMHQEEKAILTDVDRCAADVTGLLRVDPEARLVQALEELRRHREVDDVGQALIWYAKLKKVVESPVEPVKDVERVAPRLRGELQKGFESRLAGMAWISSCIAALHGPQGEAPVD